MKLYLVEVKKLSPKEADLNFIIVIVTAPVLGILTGGFLLRRFGGYESKKSMYLLIFNTSFISLVSVSFIFVTNNFVFSSLLWVYIFLGGMIDPCCQGYIVRVLPLNLKGTGNSLLQLVANIFSFGLCPIIYGGIYQGTKNTLPSLALSLCLAVPVLATIMGILILHYKKKESLLKDNLLEKEDNFTIGNGLNNGNTPENEIENEKEKETSGRISNGKVDDEKKL